MSDETTNPGEDLTPEEPEPTVEGLPADYDHEALLTLLEPSRQSLALLGPTHHADGRPVAASFAGGFGTALTVMQYAPLVAEMFRIFATIDANFDGKWSPDEQIAAAKQVTMTLLRGVPALAQIVKNPNEVQELMERVQALVEFVKRMGKK